MDVKFSAIITPDCLAFVTPDGISHSYQESMSEDVFEQACDYIRAIQRCQSDETPDDEYMMELIEELLTLLSPIKIINKHGEGRVVVENGQVLFNGEPVHNAITENIIWGLSKGFDVKPYMAFLEMLQENPSKRAVDELFGFIQRYKLVLTDDGYILAYKKVRPNFLDIHSGTIDNSVGKVVQVKRNTVDDNFGVLCSEGLHCCSFEYLLHYSSCHDNRVLLLKIHPRDVVSIPEQEAAKMRVCEYEVLREVPYNFGLHSEHLTQDHLAETPVWSNDALFGTTSDIEEGDFVRYVGLETQYGLLDKTVEYKVSHIQDWGGTAYISVDEFPDNTIFVLNEFELVEKGYSLEREFDDDEDLYDEREFDDEDLYDDSEGDDGEER